MEPEELQTEQKIDQYVTGQLTERQAEALWTTLLLEPDKLDYLKNSANLHRAYASARARVNYLYRLVAAAAAMLLIVVMVNLFRFTEADYIREGLILQNIDDTGFATLRELRDDGMSVTEEDSMFDTALNLAFSGNVERARDEFEKVARKFPLSVSASKAWMNIGIMLFNEKKFADADNALVQAIELDKGENRFLREKMLWFRANTLFNLKKFTEARAVAFEALQLDGAYHDDALELIRFIDYKLGSTDAKPLSEN